MEECFHSIDDLQYKHIEPDTVCEHNITKAMCNMWFLQQSYFTHQTYNKVFVSKLLDNMHPAYGFAN